MIITIKGADFSAANIGTLSTYIISKSIGSGAVYEIPNFVEKNSSATWTITLNEGYTFGTYSVTMGGETVTPTVADNVMTISIPSVTGNVRIVVATINESTGEEDNPVVPPVEPEIPTTTTWYIDHRNNVSKFTNSVNIAGRGWCHIPGTNGYNAIVGRPINAIGIITNLASQNITIGVVTYKGSYTDMRTIGTYTLINPNGTTKSFVSCKIDEVTLNNNECLVLYAQEDNSIQFYYLSSGGPVTDANGIADGNFAGRVPKVYGSGNAWTEYDNKLSLGISYGYILE